MWVGSHYFLLANAIYAWQIYGAAAIKSGRATALKAIMTVEATGLAWPLTSVSVNNDVLAGVGAPPLY